MDPSPQTRRPVLGAAVEVFAERGYLATSVDDLHQAMSLDAAAFQSRFAGKEGCFLAAYDSVVAVAHAALSDALSAQAPWPTRLATALHHLLALIDTNSAAARLVLVESQFAGEAALRRYMATLKNFAPFMHDARRCATTTEHPPPILDSVLPAGVAFTLRHQLLRRAHARDLYLELLGCLLRPYLGEAKTASYLALALPAVVGHEA